jgi:hypothetical protein
LSYYVYSTFSLKPGGSYFFATTKKVGKKLTAVNKIAKNLNDSLFVGKLARQKKSGSDIPTHCATRSNFLNAFSSRRDGALI